MTEVPATLSTATSTAGGRARPKRARHNIPGEKGSVIPPARPGQVMFRLFPSNETLRVWGRRRGFKVKDRGPVPKEVRDDWHRWNAWSVRVISLQAPGDTQAREYYQVMQGKYIRKQTTKWWQVENELGDDLFPLLKKVKTT
jgi:hypothetical protein